MKLRAGISRTGRTYYRKIWKSRFPTGKRHGKRGLRTVRSYSVSAGRLVN